MALLRKMRDAKEHIGVTDDRVFVWSVRKNGAEQVFGRCKSSERAETHRIPVRLERTRWKDGEPLSPHEEIWAWLFRESVYETVEWLEPDEVMALILESENRLKAQIAKAKALQVQVEAIEQGSGRQPIAGETKMFVWQRDGGRCVQCGSNKNLEFDHIIPVVMGGSNTARNLQLLCEVCNRQKGGSLV